MSCEDLGHGARRRIGRRCRPGRWRWRGREDGGERGAVEGGRELGLVAPRGPAELRVVAATGQDLRPGLARLRLEGELTEVRAGQLRFSLAEARELFAAARVELPEA